MKKTASNNEQALQLFRQAVADAKPLQQDTIRHQRSPTNQRTKPATEKQQSKLVDQFFSDDFEPHLDFSNGVEFRQQDLPAHQLKRLKRGDLAPELMLDVHGLSRAEVKKELLALFQTSRAQWIEVVSVMHGQGSGILKNQLPKWLVQHPDVLAFCAAPREFGGRNALLILLRTSQDEQSD
jgi:DNA-nicking Smr family endonuclease